jgi:hypothetical protein
MGEEIERDRKDGEVKGKMEGRGRKTEQEGKTRQGKGNSGVGSEPTQSSKSRRRYW